jgi:DNA-directed RNA polymerase subunit RPC12/RpoP
VKFRILATLSVLLLSAPSALGVQRALAPTRGELAGWLAAVGIELAYLSLAFAAFEDRQRQRMASRVARAAVLTAITLNVLADYAARVPTGLSSAAQFLATFDWLLLALSVLESAPLATLAYTLATLLHTHSGSHPQPDASHTDTHTAHHTAHTDTHTAHTDTHTAHTDTHTAHHTAHTDTHTAHTQRTTYRCPHCGAALEKQQQYAAALRYGYCGKCKGK